MNHSKLHGEASYLRRPKLFKASSRQPRRPPRQPQPPPAAQPPGRAATSTTNRDLRRLLDLRGAATFATNSDPLTSQPPIPLFNQATRQLLMSPPHACKPHWHKISGCPRQRNRTQPNKTQLKVTFLSSRKYFCFSLSCHPRRFPLFASSKASTIEVQGHMEHGTCWLPAPRDTFAGFLFVLPCGATCFGSVETKRAFPIKGGGTARSRRSSLQPTRFTPCETTKAKQHSNVSLFMKIF